MFKIPSLRFKSITYRLIFACVMAAIVIYSASFWQMRQTTQRGVLAWMSQVAQGRVDDVAAQVAGVLQSVSQNADLVLMGLLSQPSGAPTSALLRESLLQTLMAQQTTIATLVLQQSPLQSQGLKRTDGGYLKASPQDITTLLSYCSPQTSGWKTGWKTLIPPDSRHEFARIIYCSSPVPPKASEGHTPSSQILAVELNLSWINTLVAQKLKVVDHFNHTTVGHPWFIDLKTQQWIVPPSPKVQQLPWFTQVSDLSTLIQNSPEIISNTSDLKDFKPLNLTPSQVWEDPQGTLVMAALPSMSWYFGMAFSNGELEVFFQKYLLIIIMSMGKDMLLMCIAIVLASRHTTQPLRSLIVAVEDIAQGNLDTHLPALPQQDEVGRLGRSFRNMRDSLKNYIEELKTTTIAKQKIESELAIASEIQRSMLPKTDVVQGMDQRYELSTLHQPARIVGGDLYDFFLLGADRLCIIIGDVADKGVPAALMMARTVTLIRLIAKRNHTPTGILEAVNRELCINNDECLFVTLFCGILNLPTGVFHYASGGHEPPLLVQNHQVEFLPLNTGPSLGLEEDAIFPDCEVLIHPNDLLLLYTDGITEAMNAQGDFFSEARLLETIACYPPSSPSRAVRTIQHFHRQFVAEADQSDDLTLLALQYLPLSAFSQDIFMMEWQIIINSEITELERVKQRLGEILQAKALRVEIIEDIQLIVEEILVNIIQYGYSNGNCQPINLQVKISSRTLSLIFEDSGKPFNPLLEITPPDLSMEDEERALGGLGFYIVQELSDHLDYTYQDHKNILTVTRNLS